MVARASGAAQRRKLRRLRAALRHEQQSIAMALASALHHSADKTTRAQYNAPRGQKNAGTECYELSDEDVVPARGSRPPCLGEPRGHRSGISSVPWSRLPFMPLWYRFWMSLWRRWENSWWTCSSSLMRSHLLPSRLSKCPRSSLSASRREPRFASRSWRNSWWKSRRSYHSEDRVQQVPSRSLILPVEVFKVFAQDRVLLHHLHQHLVFMVLQMGLVKGFSHFSPK